MTVEWTGAADSDLEEIARFIGRENPTAAVKTVPRIIYMVDELLVENSALGRPGRIPQTRELVVSGTPFIIAYRVRDGALQVLRVLHGSRKWPDEI